MTTFGPKEQRQFSRDGYLRLGRIISIGQLQALCDRIDAIMLGEVRYEEMSMQLDATTGSYKDIPASQASDQSATLAYRRVDDLDQDPLFLNYMQHPLFREITRALIGTEVSVFRSMFMNKPAAQGTPLPWHQDVGIGWGLDSNPTVTIWTALDPATVANGCMQIVPGSHNLGVLSERHYTSEADEARYATEDKCSYLEAKPGEAILLHNFLLHRSGVNETGGPRRAFSSAYMDAATRSVSSDETFPVIFGEQALTVKT
jgi:phytanoyl-CoA hydroxylase